MTTVYLARHGETEWNVKSRVQGHIDVELSQNGRAQSIMLAERMSKENIDYIYSSDLLRSYETASYIAERLRIKVNVLKDLREIHFGVWEGLSIDYIKENYASQYNYWIQHPEKAEIPGEKNLYNVQKRIMNCIKRLVKIHEHDNILIVSHAAVIKVAILGFMDMNMSLFSRIWLANASVSVLDFNKDKVVLSLLNDRCHLSKKVGF